MYTVHRFSFRTGAMTLLLIGLLAAACAPAAKPIAKSTAVAQPTQAAQPTAKPQPTTAPAKEPTPAPQVSTLGKMLKAGDLSLLPSSVEALGQSGEQSPKAGDAFLLVKLLAENANKTSALHFDPGQFTLAGPNGQTYSMVALKALPDELHAQDIKPGSTLEGLLAFEAPQKGHTLQLEFKDDRNQELIWAIGETPAVATIPEITIKAKDYSFDAPVQIEAGLVSITLVNDGKEPHQAQLARLNEGVTLAKLQEALKKGPAEALPLVTLEGGPNAIRPGNSQQVTLRLEAGHYVLLCFVSDEDNVPHVAKGMVAPLEVVAATAQSNAPEPKADAGVTLKDFAFDLPKDIKTGKTTWKVTNDGPQPHELTLVKLAEGKTMSDVTAFLKSPKGQAPFEEAGGIGALAKGMTGWVTVDLKPGNYVAMCLVPDPTSGKAHAELGMLAAFTVK